MFLCFPSCLPSSDVTSYQEVWLTSVKVGFFFLRHLLATIPVANLSPRGRAASCVPVFHLPSSGNILPGSVADLSVSPSRLWCTNILRGSVADVSPRGRAASCVPVFHLPSSGIILRGSVADLSVSPSRLWCTNILLGSVADVSPRDRVASCVPVFHFVLLAFQGL